MGHQIGVLRTGSRIIRRATEILDSRDGEIFALIDRAEPTRNVPQLISELQSLNRAAVDGVGTYLGPTLLELYDSEVDYQDDALARVTRRLAPRARPAATAGRTAVVSRPFQGGVLREWVAGLRDGRARRLREAVRRAQGAESSPAALLRSVRGTATAGFKDGVLSVSRRGLALLVRTAVSHVACAALDDYYTTNARFVSGLRWVAALDVKTSSPCRSLDGDVYKIGAGPRPPIHPGCRTVMAPVLRAWDQIGIPEDADPQIKLDLDGLPAHRVTYSDWLALQPATEQDEILGRSRGRLFRQGSLVLDRFVDASRQEYTLDQLRRRDALSFQLAGV